MALRGAELADPDEQLTFDAINVEIDGLLEFTERRPIEVEPVSSDAGGWIGVDVKYRESERLETLLNDGGVLSVEFPWSTDGDGFNSVNVSQRCVIRRTWTESQPLDTALEEANLFRHLLTLAYE